MLVKQFLLFLFLISIGTTLFSQEKIPVKKEVVKKLENSIQLMREGQYDQSLIKCRQTLREAILLKDNNLIASTYNTIGANFDQFSDPEKSYFYYNKALIYADKTNNYELKNWLYNNLANIYCFDKKQYKKGIDYYKKSLEYSRKIHDSVQLVFTQLNMAWAFFDTNQFDKGFPYLQFVNKHQEKHGDSLTVVALNMLNGMYYGNKKETQKATFYFEKAIRLGNIGNEKSDLSYSYLEYSKFLKQIGDYKKSLQNLNSYIAINEEINDEEKLNRAKAEGINLKIDEYKREIEKIESEYKTKQDILIQEKSLSQKKYFAVVILFCIAIVLFYFYVQNTRLIQKNRYNGLRNKIQQNIINATVSGQEMERKKIASFLHDNISAILTAAKLHLNVYSSKNQHSSEEIAKTLTLLSDAHAKVRDLSHDLIPALLVRFGLFYALQDLCEKHSNSTINFEYDSTIDTQTRYAEEFEMKIYFIISELVNNVMKHSNATESKISIEENEDLLKIIIFDNGKGFDTIKFNLIEGFGLNQIKARINSMNGNLKITSKISIGTIIELEVPLYSN